MIAPTFSGGKSDLRQTGVKPQSKRNTLRVFMIDKSKVYKSLNYGTFKITEYIDSQHVKIKFLTTGYSYSTQLVNINSGAVKDKLYPSIHGVGFIGDGNYSASTSGSNSKAYSVWRGMIDRCYCKKQQKKKPSYIGCSVCDEWHNFQVFAEWFYLNYIDGCHLDKDIKIKGNKVYSPKACMFVPVKENSADGPSKAYRLINKSGVVFNVYNLSKFCRDNNINRSTMGSVCDGRVSSHKGWSIAR